MYRPLKTIKLTRKKYSIFGKSFVVFSLPRLVNSANKHCPRRFLSSSSARIVHRLLFFLLLAIIALLNYTLHDNQIFAMGMLVWSSLSLSLCCLLWEEQIVYIHLKCASERGPTHSSLSITKLFISSVRRPSVRSVPGIIWMHL